MPTEAQPEGGRDDWVRDQMQKIASLVDEEIPQGWGFAVFVFPLDGRQGRTNYVSSGRREDILIMLRKFLERHERQDILGSHA
jgi:hypothetical protein